MKLMIDENKRIASGNAESVRIDQKNKLRAKFEKNSVK